MLERLGCAFALTTVVILSAITAPQKASAQLLAYEGFDYENGDLGIQSLGPLAGGIGWAPGTGTGLGWIEDASFTSGFAPGQGNTSVVDNPDDWGYTDANGNVLRSSGRAVLQNEWNKYRRNIDYSGMIPANDPGSLLRVGPGGIEGIGAGGAELWISFIGRGVPYDTSSATEGGDNALSSFGLVDNDDFESGRLNVELGRSWKTPDGPADGPVPSGPGQPTANGNEAWTLKDHGISPKRTHRLGKRYDEKVFYVARIQFKDSGDPIPGDADNFLGYEVGTAWADPILGSTAPSEESAVVTDLILGDNVVVGMWFSGNADTFYDEIRFGLTYADVAPIAAAPGIPGDFDNDLDVDGADFLAWQRDMGVGNLADWEANFGTVGAVSAVSAVPEPASMFLLASSMAFVLATRRRRSV